MRTALAPDALNKEANYAFPLEGLPRSVAYRARLLDEAPEGMTLRCADGEGQTTLLLLPDEMPEISLMAAPITKSYTLTLRLGLNGADAQDIPVAVQLSKDPPPAAEKVVCTVSGTDLADARVDSTSDSGATLTISPKSADGLSYAVTVGMDENFTIAVKDHEDYSYTDPTPASGTFVNGAATVEATAMKLIDYTFYVNWNDNATANRPNSVTYTLQSNTADSEW